MGLSRHFYDHNNFVHCYHEKQPQKYKVCERGEIGDKNAYDVGNGNDRVSGSNHGPGRTDRSRLGGEQNGL